MIGYRTCFPDEIDHITSVGCLSAECIFESQHELKFVDYYCMSYESGNLKEVVNRLCAIVPCSFKHFEDIQDNVDYYHPYRERYLHEAVLIL